MSARVLASPDGTRHLAFGSQRDTWLRIFQDRREQPLRASVWVYVLSTAALNIVIMHAVKCIYSRPSICGSLTRAFIAGEAVRSKTLRQERPSQTPVEVIRPWRTTRSAAMNEHVYGTAKDPWRPDQRVRAGSTTTIGQCDSPWPPDHGSGRDRLDRLRTLRLERIAPLQAAAQPALSSSVTRRPRIAASGPARI